MSTYLRDRQRNRGRQALSESNDSAVTAVTVDEAVYKVDAIHRVVLKAEKVDEAVVDEMRCRGK